MFGIVASPLSKSIVCCSRPSGDRGDHDHTSSKLAEGSRHPNWTEVGPITGTHVPEIDAKASGFVVP
jgi:hypothetical protein